MDAGVYRLSVFTCDYLLLSCLCDTLVLEDLSRQALCEGMKGC
jgi:hypothetical protein